MDDQASVTVSPIGEEIYGFRSASAEALKNYGYALLAVAGADRAVSPREWDWLSENFGETLLLPADILDAYVAFDYRKADLADIVAKIVFDTPADYRCMVLYDAIRMSQADGHYHEDEERAVCEAAEHMGLDLATVKTLEDLIAAENAATTLRHALFEIDYSQEPDEPPADDHRLRHNPWITRQFGYSCTTLDSITAFCETLMAVAGADRAITDPEWRWLDEISLVAGVPDDIRAGFRDFDYHNADIDALMTRFVVDRELNLNRVLVYLTIKMAQADRRYADEEQRHAYRVARRVGVTIPITRDLEALVELENALEDLRKSIFRVIPAAEEKA